MVSVPDLRLSAAQVTRQHHRRPQPRSDHDQVICGAPVRAFDRLRGWSHGEPHHRGRSTVRTPHDWPSSGPPCWGGWSPTPTRAGRRVDQGLPDAVSGIDLVEVPDGPKRTKNRAHLDLSPTDRDQDAELERLLALGAREVDVGQGERRRGACPRRPGGQRVPASCAGGSTAAPGSASLAPAAVAPRHAGTTDGGSATTASDGWPDVERVPGLDVMILLKMLRRWSKGGGRAATTEWKVVSTAARAQARGRVLVRKLLGLVWARGPRPATSRRSTLRTAGSVGARHWRGRSPARWGVGAARVVSDRVTAKGWELATGEPPPAC